MNEPGWQVRSPTGRFRIETDTWEAFNTHWVATPTLLDTTTNQILLVFSDHRWSMDEAHWLDDNKVSLTMRRYPGNHKPPDVVAVIDCAAGTAKVGDKEMAISALETALNEALTWIHG